MKKQQPHPINQPNNLIFNTINIYSHAIYFVKPSRFTRTMLKYAHLFIQINIYKYIYIYI